MAPMAGVCDRPPSPRGPPASDAQSLDLTPVDQSSRRRLGSQNETDRDAGEPQLPEHTADDTRAALSAPSAQEVVELTVAHRGLKGAIGARAEQLSCRSRCQAVSGLTDRRSNADAGDAELREPRDG